MFDALGNAAVRLGDETTHGGKVISATSRYILHGVAVAKANDLTQCPKCKGTFPILSSAGAATEGGETLAFDGTSTACGATLIASFSAG